MSDKNYASYWKGKLEGYEEAHLEFQKLIDGEITNADTRQDFNDLGLGTYFHGVIRGLQILKEKWGVK